MLILIPNDLFRRRIQLPGIAEQIVEIRECGAPGFSVFNFDKRALDALPQIFKNETGGIDE